MNDLRRNISSLFLSAGRALAVCVCSILTIFHVTPAFAQDAAAAVSSLDRWVEITVVVVLVFVLFLLNWIERPTRTHTGSYTRIPFDLSEEPGSEDFRLSSYASGAAGVGDDEDTQGHV